MRGLWVVFIVMLTTISWAQEKVTEDYLMASVGLKYFDQLTPFNDILVDAGYDPIKKIGLSTSLCYGNQFNQFSIQGRADYNSMTSSEPDDVLLTSYVEVQLNVNFAYNLIKSNDRLRLEPGLSLGFAKSSVYMQFLDTTTTFTEILQGQTSTFYTRSKIGFVLTPNVKFSLSSKSVINRAIIMELGHYISPFELSWQQPDLGIKRFNGFYFRVGLLINLSRCNSSK